jgi:hypothetical protein
MAYATLNYEDGEREALNSVRTQTVIAIARHASRPLHGEAVAFLLESGDVLSLIRHAQRLAIEVNPDPIYSDNADEMVERPWLYPAEPLSVAGVEADFLLGGETPDWVVGLRSGDRALGAVVDAAEPWNAVIDRHPNPAPGRSVRVFYKTLNPFAAGAPIQATDYGHAVELPIDGRLQRNELWNLMNRDDRPLAMRMRSTPALARARSAGASVSVGDIAQIRTAFHVVLDTGWRALGDDEVSALLDRFGVHWR